MAVVLRPYQREAIDKVKESANRGVRRVLTKVFTGGGKSLIAVGIHKEVLPGEPTLFLVDQIELAKQMYDHFTRNFPDLHIGMEMGEFKADKNVDILVASVQTLGHIKSSRFKKFNTSRFKKIICDESHKSTAPIWQRVLHAFQVGNESFDEDKVLVGMTATVNRTDGVGLSVNFDDIVCDYNIKYGIVEGWLTDIELLQVNSNVDISGVKSSKEDFNITQLEEAVNTQQRNALILKSYKELADGEKAIVYCASVKHAHELAALFTKNGYSAYCIEGGTDKSDRRDWIDGYKNGDIQVLFNHSTLTTGFDAPETKALILGRPIKSPLLFEQIVGRGLRPSSGTSIDLWADGNLRRAAIEFSDKPVCKIIDICDEAGKHKIASLASLFGLAPKAKTQKKRFVQDVVMPIEELKHEHNIDVSDIIDLDNMSIQVKKRKMRIGEVNTPQEIKAHSNRPWIPVGETEYECVYREDDIVLIIRKNEVDKYDLYEYNLNTKVERRMQTFAGLTGAVKVADEYAKQNLKKTKYNDFSAKWVGEPPSQKQIDLLIRLKRGHMVRFDNVNREPNGVPTIYYNDERLTRGAMKNLLDRILNK
jgi:superfamily II DNA or RNA helicase